MFNELAKEIHQNAVEHGWWDKEPTFGSLISLMHSELSEALEELRSNRPMMYFVETNGFVVSDMSERKDEKPEGIAVELADCIIRILDWAGREEVDVDYYIKTMEENRYHESVIDDDFGGFIAVCHSLLSGAYTEKDEVGKSMHLCLEIVYIMDWATKEGVDMYAIIREKMDYNKTRPYRHGGKAL